MKIHISNATLFKGPNTEIKAFCKTLNKKERYTNPAIYKKYADIKYYQQKEPTHNFTEFCKECIESEELGLALLKLM